MVDRLAISCYNVYTNEEAAIVPNFRG
ncbi:uncharacterized protein METZ01_LOCUS256414, partial [marine metagenome]